MKSVVVLFFALFSNSALAQTVITGEPYAPMPPRLLGTGACAKVVLSAQPTTDFPADSPATFFQGLTTFLALPGAEPLVDTFIDFANAFPNAAATQGDLNPEFFDDACPASGCEFPGNPTGAFGMRMRGYLAIPDFFTNQDTLIGANGDDAFRIIIYDGALAPHVIVSHAPDSANPGWRVGSRVRFEKPGLYPFEFEYVQVGASAWFEPWYGFGPAEEGDDFDEAGTLQRDTSLEQPIVPANIFTTTTTSGVATCRQCPRDQIGNGGTAAGCGENQICNGAGLCEGEAVIVDMDMGGDMPVDMDVEIQPTEDTGGETQVDLGPDSMTTSGSTTGSSGCGCSSPDGGVGIWILLGLFGMRRKRR